jgi:dual-specificity kinase
MSMHWLDFLKCDAPLKCKPADVLDRRYRVVSGPMAGSYAHVYICVDLETREQVAIKAFPTGLSTKWGGEREAKLLQIMNQIDPDGEFFLRYLRSFRYCRHFCFVQECYGMSLYSCQKLRRMTPVPLPAVRWIIYRLIQSVKLLHDHEMIHTDIKLENLLLPPGFDPKTGFDKLPIAVKLIDFGTIVSSGTWHRHLATTRLYRSPEITMGLPWASECDIWSSGCLLVELVLGKIPFSSKDPVMQLFLIQQLIGAFPAWMSDRVTNAAVMKAFVCDLMSPDALSDSQKREAMARPALFRMLQDYPAVCDLALGMLKPDPMQRISIEGILAHPFFDDVRGCPASPN